jgi:cytochrome c2
VLRRAGFTLAAILAVASVAGAQDTVRDFKQNCSSCHTIGGGRLVGPDLKDVADRRERAWLTRFIVDPNGVIDSGDAIAAKLLEEARGVRMPPIAGMSRARAEALLDLIDTESKLEKSRFAGVSISDRPFTAADVALGRALFTGATALRGGGLGGGRLGPDLTKVFERYGDRKTLGAWLSAPATVTMAPTFREHPIEEDEIFGLIAYFDHIARVEEEDHAPHALVLILLAVAGAAGSLLLIGRIWRDRFRGVRRPLVDRSALRSAPGGEIR